MILRKQERNDLFYGATKFYARPREWANIGCTAIIITCFISRAYGFLAATHRRVYIYIPSSHVWYVDRYVIPIGAYTFALAFARAPLTPMTRIGMHMSSTGTETDGKSLLRARPRADPPPPPLCRATLYESPVNPRERVIYRKCNRRDWSREVRSWRAKLKNSFLSSHTIGFITSVFENGLKACRLKINWMSCCRRESR